jgi:hypothetical protein
MLGVGAADPQVVDRRFRHAESGSSDPSGTSIRHNGSQARRKSAVSKSPGQGSPKGVLAIIGMKRLHGYFPACGH